MIGHTQEEWRVLVETATFTGARISELLGLTFEDLGLVQGSASISISKQLARTGESGKTKTENGVRVIGISERLRVSLLTHFNGSEDKRPEAHVFGQHAQPVGRYRLAARALTKAIKEAGIEFDPEKERVSFHCFRHGVAWQLVRSNVDPKSLADHLGDSVEVVLSTYVHSVGNGQNLGELIAVGGL